MASNDVNQDKIASPKGANDFTRIRGISPKIAARLHEAGILTFEKLAAMTPSEVVARIGTTSGITAEVIAKKDWSGQAAALLAKATANESEGKPAGDNADGNSGHHSVSYIVQFTLDEHRRVKSTKVHHVQSGDEKSWDRWDAAKLTGFFTKRPELNLPQETQAAANVQVSASHSQLSAPESKKLPGKMAAPTGAIHLRQVELIPETTNAPSWGLQRSQSFHARVNLDLSQVISGLPPNEMEYTAVFRAKGLGEDQVHTLGEAQGTLTPEKSITLNAQGNSLPPGVYRVFASVTLNPLEQSSFSEHTLIARAEGNLLEIY